MSFRTSEVEVGGRRYTVRELTLREVIEIQTRTVQFEVDEGYRIRPRVDVGLMKLMLLEKCIQEPSLDRAAVESLPASVARRLLDECVRLNPDFRGI